MGEIEEETRILSQITEKEGQEDVRWEEEDKTDSGVDARRMEGPP